MDRFPNAEVGISVTGKKRSDGKVEDERTPQEIADSDRDAIKKLWHDLSKVYGWLPHEIDMIDLDVLFDYLSVMLKDDDSNEEQGVYIDQIMP